MFLVEKNVLQSIARSRVSQTILPIAISRDYKIPVHIYVKQTTKCKIIHLTPTHKVTAYIHCNFFDFTFIATILIHTTRLQ